MENSNKNRIIGLDIIKTIATIFVIARHVPIVCESNIQILDNYWYLQLIVNLLNCGVPLFFAVDGFLLLSKKEFDFNKYFKRLVKIIILYFIWSLTLILINLLFDHTAIDKFIILDLILKLNNASTYTTELWFLEALFAIYLIYPLVWLAFNKEDKIFYSLFTIVFVITFIPNVISILSTLVTNEFHMFYLTKLVDLIDKFNLFNYGWFLLYFLLGGFIYKKKELLSDKKIIFIIAGFVSFLISYIYLFYITKNNKFITNYNDKSLFEVLIIVGYFALFLNTDANNKLISFIGKNTFGVYVTHQFMIRIARLFIGQDLFIQNLAIVVVSLLLSLILTYLLGLIPFVKKSIKL